MALGAFHADGVTPIDPAHPLSCSYTNPGVFILKCGQYERSSQAVSLQNLPPSAELSVDDGPWGALDMGVVSTGTTGRIRPKVTARAAGFVLTTIAAYGGVLEAIPDTIPPTQPVLSLEGGVEQLVGVWTAATDDRGVIDHYLWQTSTVDTFASIEQSGTTAGDVLTFTAAASGGTRYSRVCAVDPTGNQGEWSVVRSAVVTSDPDKFVDTFDALDAARWGTLTAGAGTAGVDTGELVLASPATTDAAGAYLKAGIPAAIRMYRHKARVTAQSATNSTVLFLGVQDGNPIVGTAVGDVFAKNLCMVRIADNGTAPYASITYYDTAAVLQRWNGSGWQTTTVSLANPAYALGSYIYVDLEVTPTQWRVTTRDSALNLLHQTAWVDWSATRQPAGSKIVAFGDFANDGIGVTLRSDSFSVS